jgi:hypothetical protein
MEAELQHLVEARDAQVEPFRACCERKRSMLVAERTQVAERKTYSSAQLEHARDLLQDCGLHHILEERVNVGASPNSVSAMASVLSLMMNPAAQRADRVWMSYTAARRQEAAACLRIADSAFLPAVESEQQELACTEEWAKCSLARREQEAVLIKLCLIVLLSHIDLKDFQNIFRCSRWQ